MKKLFIILLIASLFIAPCWVAAEETDSSVEAAGTEENNNTPDKGVGEIAGNGGGSIPKLEVNWQEMQDMQIALAMINRHIEYLMAQVEKNDAQIAAIREEHARELEKAEANKKEEIEKINQKLAEKDRQLDQARDEINKLSSRAALFSAENDMMPRFILVFGAGIVLGMIVNSLWSAIRKRDKS